jgi:hypothetical protein
MAGQRTGHRLRHNKLSILDDKLLSRLNAGERLEWDELFPPHSSSILVQRATRPFNWLERMFPRRVLTEEIGDALEIINNIANDPDCHRPKLKIMIKVVTTTFWVMLNSIRLLCSSVLGKKAD